MCLAALFPLFVSRSVHLRAREWQGMQHSVRIPHGSEETWVDETLGEWDDSMCLPTFFPFSHFAHE